MGLEVVMVSFVIYINICKFLIINVSKSLYSTSEGIAFFLSLMHGITRIYIQGNIIIGGTKWGCLEATADWRALPKKAVYWKIFHWL